MVFLRIHKARSALEKRSIVTEFSRAIPIGAPLRSSHSLRFHSRLNKYKLSFVTQDILDVTPCHTGPVFITASFQKYDLMCLCFQKFGSVDILQDTSYQTVIQAKWCIFSTLKKCFTIASSQL